MTRLAGLRDFFHGVRLSARLLAGRRFWLVPFIPLAWTAFQALFLVTAADHQGFSPVSAQGTLIGLPLTVLAIFLGVRVIAGELDARRLEIVYTVPGGSHRVWFAKLAAALALLAAAEVLLALATWFFFTPFPVRALYGAFQPALVYLALATGLAALFKSEVTGAMVTAGILFANGFLTSFGDNPTRFSPFWNPLVRPDTEPTQLLAWALQNRLGFLLLAAALVALACARAERREKMLSG